MTLWIIDPRDPLIFGDGKPFSAIPGSRVKSIPFPAPSTIAGAVRTRAGCDPKTGKFDKTRINELLQRKIRGPLLVELSVDGDQVSEWLFPVPADVTQFRADSNGEDTAILQQIVPLEIGAGETDLSSDLRVVGAPHPVKGKPHPRAPQFWRWSTLKEWLLNPKDGERKFDVLGHDGPVREHRVHVSIDAETKTALEGHLFQTSGLEFRQLNGGLPNTVIGGSEIGLSALTGLALAVDTDANFGDGLDFLGGERRIVGWRQATGANADFPNCPEQLVASIVSAGACRLILLTPAFFSEGFRPTRILTSVPGLDTTLIGAAVGRPVSVSGWDYVQHQPKPTRRLAPAGSVYFLKFDGDEESVEKFVNSVWMNNISDDAQACLDGFGLAILGAWNGEAARLEVGS